VIQIHGQAEVGRDGLGAPVQVRAAERQPPVQRARIVVVRASASRCQRLRCRLHRVVRGRDARAPGDELTDGLTREPLRLLREIPDRRGGRADRHRSRLRRAQPGEHAQQRGLARAVRPDEADHVAGPDGQVEIGEEQAVAVRRREAPGNESGDHEAAQPTA
jgi:hypothetical protein